VVGIRVKVLKNVNGRTDFIRAAHGSEGYIPARNSLSHGDDIRLDVKVLDPEPFPGPSEPADDFIDDEKNTVFCADFPDQLPVFFGRGVGPEPLLDGFADEGGNLRGVFELDDPLKIMGTRDLTIGVGEMHRAAVAIGRVDKDASGSQGFHDLAHRKDGPEDIEGSARHPMIGPPPGDHFVPFLISLEEVIMPGHFEGRFHRLGAIADEKEPVDLSRSDFR